MWCGKYIHFYLYTYIHTSIYIYLDTLDVMFVVKPNSLRQKYATDVDKCAHYRVQIFLIFKSFSVVFFCTLIFVSISFFILS